MIKLYINNLKKHIDLINSSNDPFDLYTNRLRELVDIEDPKNSELGLFRIAYICKFKLHYNISNNIVKVMAEKTIKNNRDKYETEKNR